MNTKNVVVLVSMMAVAACSAEAPASKDSADATGSNAGAASDLGTIAASAETKEELGVEAWGFTTDADSDLVIRGYDAGGDDIAELRQTVTSTGADSSHVAISVKAKSGVAELEMDIEGRLPTAEGETTKMAQTVTRNTFEDHPDAAKMLERLQADHANGETTLADTSAATTTGQVSLGGRSLRPLADAPSGSSSSGGTELRKKSCVKISFACGAALAKTIGKGLTGAKSCVLAGKNAKIVWDCAKKEEGTLGKVGCVVEKGAPVAEAASKCISEIGAAVDEGKKTVSECKKDTPECQGGTATK